MLDDNIAEILIREPNESREEYMGRLSSAKDRIGTWKQVADIFNQVTGESVCEDTLRKCKLNKREPDQMKNSFKGHLSTKQLDKEQEELIEEYKTAKIELEKEKIKWRDERNEYKRLIREQARKESYLDQVADVIVNHRPLKLNDVTKSIISYGEESDLIIPIFDLHVGIKIDNYFNIYNEDVIKKRLSTYFEKIITIAKRHNAQNAHIVLSELVSGIIHPTLRIESNKDLIEQFLLAMDMIEWFLSSLSVFFEKIYVYVAIGNHSRITPQKEESMSHENIEHLVLPTLKRSMKNYSNIILCENNIDHTIAVINVRNLCMYASHGDKDNFEKAVEKLTMYMGKKPDLYLCGHRHYNATTTSYDSKVIQTGSIMGSPDEYCAGKRLRNKAEQAVMVITDKDGLDCIYDVTLE